MQSTEPSHRGDEEWWTSQAENGVSKSPWSVLFLPAQLPPLHSSTMDVWYPYTREQWTQSGTYRELQIRYSYFVMIEHFLSPTRIDNWKTKLVGRKFSKVYRDSADCVFIFHLFLCCFLRLGAFKTACEFLAALAGRLGFESLSPRLRTSQLLRERSKGR